MNLPLTGVAAASAKMHAPDGRFFEVTLRDSGETADERALFADERQVLKLRYGKLQPELHAWTETAAAADRAWVWIWADVKTTFVAREELLASESVAKAHDEQVKKELDAALGPIREWLAKNAPDAERGDASGPMLRGKLSRSEVKALAELPQVSTLGTDSYPGKPTSSPWSATSQWGATLRLDWAHYGSTGSGSKVCVKEYGRPDDTSKLVIAATANPSGTTDVHARGMAGLIRNTDATAMPFRCVAPSATVYIANWYGFTGTGGVDEWCRTNGTPIINYAYEVAPGTTTLTATDWAHDWLAKNSPYVVVVATAGVADWVGYVQNRGFNGLVVGAVDDHNTGDRSDDTWPTYSGWRNPTTAHNDHELPHIVAPGNGASVTGTEFSGTSAATAMGSGATALLTGSEFGGWPEMRRAVMLATSTGRADQGLLTTLSGSGDMRIGAGEIDAFQAADLGTAYSVAANAVAAKGRTAFTANFTSSFGTDGYLTTKWKAKPQINGRLRVVLTWDATATCPSGTSGACTGDTSDGDFDLHLFKKTDGTWTTTGEMPCSSSRWDSTWEMCDISVLAGEEYLIGVRKYGTSGSSTYMSVAWYSYVQAVGQPCGTGTDCTWGCNAGRCVCSGDYQCPDRYCDASGQCANRQANGAACARAEQCVSGNCVDGVCCDSPCTGTCMACLAGKKGWGADGVCGAIASGTDPEGECPAQTCTAGTVTPRQTCNGAGGCTANPTYTCGGYLCSGAWCSGTCSSDAMCAAGYYCSGTSCVGKKANGLACTAANQCTSGFCTDGVCCDSLCNGSCQACSATKKGTGANGTCGYVVNGSDPDVECVPQQTCTGGTVTRAYACNGSGACTSMGTYSCSGYVCSGTGCRTNCGTDADCTAGSYCSGTSCVAKKANGLGCTATNQCTSGFCTDGVCCDSLCNGSCQACSATKKGSGFDGSCGYIVSGSDPDTECAAQTCTGGTVTRAYACNGSGSCTSMGTYSCGGFVCSGAGCSPTCASDAGCTAGYYCSGTSCVAKKANGAACTATNQCASGNCVDGVCCDSLCNGTCQACSASRKGSGVDGTCGFTADGGNALGMCPVTCVDGVVGSAPVCNGSGGCRPSSMTSCGGFGCSGSACATTCGPSTPCASTHYCLGGSCVLKLANGSACASAAECTSGNCVDGVCCNTGCGAACQACNVAGSVGTCTATDEAGCAPICGSGVRNAAEECDDGLGTSTSVRRACSSTCIVQDLPVAPSNSTSPARTLGTGRHPIAVAANGHAVVYIEDASSTARVALATFDNKGVAQDPPKVVAPSAPLAANPVVAALPDGKFVVGYTSIGGDGDSLGVVLHKVDPIAGPLGADIVANGTTAFSQYDADMLWTGSELVVAWVDTSSFTTGADLKFRRFNSSLAAIAAEETLANTTASESDVALAPFGTSWAAAWRAASGGAEQIMVRAAGKTWNAAVTMPGPAGVRPTLVELDSTHLLVVFVEQGLDTTTGELTPNQLRGAIVDTTTTAGPLATFAIGASPSTTPVLTRVGTRTYFAWNREAVVGDEYADELWLQDLTWTGAAVDFTATPMLLPRATDHRLGDQRWPALAGTGALITAWEDYGASLGVPRTAVVTQFVPLPVVRTGAP